VTGSLPARGSAEVTVGTRGRASSAVVTVDDSAGLQADNARYLVFDGGTRPTLLVVSANGDPARDAFYVQQAITAARDGAPAFQTIGASGAQLSTWDPSRLDTDAAVLLLSTRGLERRGRETLARYVERGGGLLIAAGPDVDGDVAADTLGADAPLRIAAEPNQKPSLRALAPADVRHPIFQAFDPGAPALGLVRFQRVAQISGRSCQTLARFTTSESALIECSAGQGHGLIFASDLDNRWNDFPLHPTFVPFLQEAARYLASGRPAAGESLVGTDGVPRVPGIVRLPSNTGSGTPARQIAVNVDPREADPARISAEEFQSAVTRLMAVTEADARIEATQQEDRQHLWQYVFVLMILALALEGLIASRTA
jgi:hypothetical protein